MKITKIRFCSYLSLIYFLLIIPERSSASILPIEANTPSRFEIAEASNSDSLLEQGNSNFNNGHYREAIEIYDRIVKNNRPNSKIAIQARIDRSHAYVVATVFESSGSDNSDLSISAAIADCNYVIGIQPTNPAGYYCRGFAYFHTKKRQEAFKDFDRAIELAPNNSKAYYERGYAYYLSDNRPQAIRDLSRSIELGANSATVYFIRASIYDRSEAQKAEQDLSRAIEIEPRNYFYYRVRGDVRVNLKNYQGAIEDFTIVIQRSPTGIADRSKRGFALAALGKYQEAIADYNQTIKSIPQHNAAHYGRALARAKIGDKKGAMSDLQTAEKNYRSGMGNGNLHQPLYKQIVKAIEQLKANPNSDIGIFFPQY